ncbi:MAG: UxaA family hydrolase [Rhodospirillales bacterium]
MSAADVIVTHPDDNVATALNNLSAGQSVTVADSHRVTILTTVENVSRGHKISLVALDSNQPVLKYGEQIGITIMSVHAGCHVHTHNMRSMRIGGAPREVKK